MKSVRLIGAKAFNLNIIDQHHFNVPNFVVLDSDTLNSLLDNSEWQIPVKDRSFEICQEGNLDIQFDEVNEEVMNVLFNWLKNDEKFKSDLSSKINSQLGQREINKLYAVRSSSCHEDGSDLSYAGQFLSLLNVSHNQLADAVIEIWQSAYSEKVIAYRKLHEESGTSAELPAVIIQEMIPADVSGVAFSADPNTGDSKTITINAVEGTAEKLVDGEQNGATYRLYSRKLIEKENTEAGKLSFWQLRKLEKTARKLEKVFGHPQDIEWAYKDNKLFILQSRNITTLNSCTQRIDIWDNSNIGESYPGVTTPLTFSFARVAYQNVYWQFCLLMGVSKDTLKENSEIFPQMLGLIQGRIYYNLLNWYRLLKLFPGYSVNQGFMEQMMGVKESIDSKDTSKTLSKIEKTKNPFIKAKAIINLGFAFFGLIYQLIMLENTSRKFYKRLESSLNKVPNQLHKKSNHELLKMYRQLEDELLTSWDAPIVNDFFAMIFYGLLNKLTQKWISETDSDCLHNQLLCGETGIISTEPAQLINAMAECAKDDVVLKAAIDGACINGNLSMVKTNKTFAELLELYLNKFGDRSCGELKLESKTLNDDPRSLLKSISAMAANKKEKGQNTTATSHAEQQRLSAEKIVADSLSSSPIKAAVFKLVLNQARNRIKARENLRFERTRVFGAVRRIFRAIGTNLEKQNLLNQREDIFFLEVEEIKRFLQGT